MDLGVGSSSQVLAFIRHSMSAEQLWCPRCEQGLVLDVAIPKAQVEAYLCDECEALWLDKATVGAQNFVDYSTFMRAHGGDGLWSELVIRGAVYK